MVKVEILHAQQLALFQFLRILKQVRVTPLVGLRNTGIANL